MKLNYQLGQGLVSQHGRAGSGDSGSFTQGFMMSRPESRTASFGVFDDLLPHHFAATSGHVTR
jgi:hypothetical protein